MKDKGIVKDMMKLARRKIDTPNDIGITILLSIPDPYGGQNFEVALDDFDLEDFRKDRAGFVAKWFGVTRDHYLRWAEYVLYPQCHATTRKGRRCLHPVYDIDFATPDRFDPEGVYFCPTHVSKS